MQEARSGASQTGEGTTPGRKKPREPQLPGHPQGDSSGGQTAAKGDAAAPKKTDRGNASTLPQPIFLRKSSRYSVLAESDSFGGFQQIS